MFSHIQLGARDLERLVDFYDAVLREFGFVRMPVEDDGGPPGCGWQRQDRPWPQFYVQIPFNGLPASWGNGVQVSFAAPSRQAVEAAWHRALQLGGSDEGAPGVRPGYGADFYAAYCRDPEGNKLCFVHAEGLVEASA